MSFLSSAKGQGPLFAHSRCLKMSDGRINTACTGRQTPDVVMTVHSCQDVLCTKTLCTYCLPHRHISGAGKGEDKRLACPELPGLFQCPCSRHWPSTGPEILTPMAFNAATLNRVPIMSRCWDQRGRATEPKQISIPAPGNPCSSKKSFFPAKPLSLQVPRVLLHRRSAALTWKRVRSAAYIW